MSVATEVDLRALAEGGAAELGPHAAAEDVLAWGAATFGGRMIVASNMQDAVLVDLAAKALPSSAAPPSARARRSTSVATLMTAPRSRSSSA